jgi:hypothetical protein
MKRRSPENPNGPENPESDRKIAGPEYFIETLAKLDPSDKDFTMEQRIGAFDRAVKSSGLSGRIEPKDFDVLYEHYRWEMDLLKHIGK